ALELDVEGQRRDRALELHLSRLRHRHRDRERRWTRNGPGDVPHVGRETRDRERGQRLDGLVPERERTLAQRDLLDLHLECGFGGISRRGLGPLLLWRPREGHEIDPLLRVAHGSAGEPVDRDRADRHRARYQISFFYLDVEARDLQKWVGMSGLEDFDTGR